MDKSELPEVELTLNPGIEKQFIRDLDLEIEALQGEREILPNGQIKLTMTVSTEKGELIKQLCLRFIAKPDEINPN